MSLQELRRRRRAAWAKLALTAAAVAAIGLLLVPYLMGAFDAALPS